VIVPLAGRLSSRWPDSASSVELDTGAVLVPERPELPVGAHAVTRAGRVTRGMPRRTSQSAQRTFTCPTRRSISAFILLLVSLYAAPSAVGARVSRSATPRAGHQRKRNHGKHNRRKHRLSSRAAANSSTILLGNEALESNRNSLIGGQAEAFPFQARAAGIVGPAYVYVDTGNTAAILLVGIYSNGAGRPDGLLSEGSLSAPKSGAWNAVPLRPTQLVSGTTYWLAILGTGGRLRYRDRSHGPCTAITSSQNSLKDFAVTWSSGFTYATCPVSAYVTTAVFALEQLHEVIPTSEPPPPSELLPPPPPAAPSNTAPPTITGTTTEGQTLTAGNGSWTESPTSYSYQWQDCNSSGESCTNISGATGSTYTLTGSDTGHTVVVIVMASNAGGSTPATSAATAVVLPLPPSNTTPPATSGKAVEGQSLTASNGTWSGSPTNYSYQWQDCNSGGESCTNTAGATVSTYKLGSTDVGHTLRVIVTATNAGGSTSASSAATATALPLPPSNTALPTISGKAVEGETLTAGNGTWSGTPTSYTYQWQDCSNTGESCTNITGATATTYKLTANDVGHTLRVAVTASNAGGSTPASSAATAAVTGPPPSSANEPFRFFSPTSFWNEPVSASVPLDPSSAAVVGAFDQEITAAEEAKKGLPNINVTSWSVPVYTVPANQPMVNVTLLEAAKTPALQAAWDAVPLPSNALPAVGTDKHLVVWQPSTDHLWEFWRLEKTLTGWQAAWGGAMEKASSDLGVYGPEAWSGATKWWGASATSLSIAGGLITLEDLEKGQINHALAMAIPSPRGELYASPAQRTDGWVTAPDSIPEGAHLWLDPNLDLASLKLPRFTLMMAEAAQKYGIFVRDRAGNVAFYAQDPTPTGTNPYFGTTGYFEGKTAQQLLAVFPWSHLQLLKMELHKEV
jgi:hypothetical protein